MGLDCSTEVHGDDAPTSDSREASSSVGKRTKEDVLREMYEGEDPTQWRPKEVSVKRTPHPQNNLKPLTDDMSELSSLSRIPVGSETAYPMADLNLKANKTTPLRKVRRRKRGSQDLFLSEEELSQLTPNKDVMDDFVQQPQQQTPQTKEWQNSSYDLNAQQQDAMVADEKQCKKVLLNV